MRGPIEYVAFVKDILVTMGEWEDFNKRSLSRGEEHLLGLLGTDVGVNIRTEGLDGDIHVYFVPWSNVVMAEVVR